MLQNASVADQGGATAPSTSWIMRIAKTQSRQALPRACKLMHLQTRPEDVSLHEWKLGKTATVTQKKWKLLILLLFFKDIFWKVLVLVRVKAFLLWLVAELHRHLEVSSVVLRKEEPVSQRFLLNWNQVKTFPFWVKRHFLIPDVRCKQCNTSDSLRNRSLSCHDLASSESFSSG